MNASGSQRVVRWLLVLAAVLVSTGGCQTVPAPRDPSVAGLRPYEDPQEQPRHGPGAGWVMLRRLAL